MWEQEYVVTIPKDKRGKDEEVGEYVDVNSLYKFFSNGTKVLISKKFSIESSINQILTKFDEIVREIGLN